MMRSTTTSAEVETKTTRERVDNGLSTVRTRSNGLITEAVANLASEPIALGLTSR